MGGGGGVLTHPLRHEAVDWSLRIDLSNLSTIAVTACSK